MQYFLQSTNEENLYLCIINGLWGSKTNKISHWNPGDIILIYLNRRLTAIFSITTEPFFDETPIWPADTYPYRVRIKLQKLVHPEHRISIGERDIRDLLYEHHTKSYAVGLVLSARPLNEEVAHYLIQYLDQALEWTGFDPNYMLNTLREQQTEMQEVIDEEVIQARSTASNHDVEASIHTQMQFHLAQLGRSMRFQIWIPKADQGRTYQGKALGELSRSELPPLPFNEEVLRIIRNIDVIWLEDEHPTRLFEVEHTTSIYSGLLRMSDLVTLIPSLNIYMYICADAERKDKVRAEVNRPTFSRRSIPLIERCRFIPFEELSAFMKTKSELLPHLNVTILDELSESLA